MSENSNGFFNERQSFDYLSRSILPEWPAGKTLTAWCCSRDLSEDTYSLALLINQQLDQRAEFKILSSAPQEGELRIARNGVFPKAALMQIPHTLHKGQIAAGKGAVSDWFRVSDAVVKRIGFKTHDLLDATYPGDAIFDVIFCRGILEALPAAAQTGLLRKLHRSVKRGGWLFISAADGAAVTPADADLWETVTACVLRAV